MTHRTMLVTQTYGVSRGGGIERYLDAICRSIDRSCITVITPPPPGTQHDGPKHAFPEVLYKDLQPPSIVRPSWLLRLPWFLDAIRSRHATRVVFGHYAG